jgi:hypothetical protein
VTRPTRGFHIALPHPRPKQNADSKQDVGDCRNQTDICSGSGMGDKVQVSLDDVGASMQPFKSAVSPKSPATSSGGFSVCLVRKLPGAILKPIDRLRVKPFGRGHVSSTHPDAIRAAQACLGLGNCWGTYAGIGCRSGHLPSRLTERRNRSLSEFHKLR